MLMVTPAVVQESLVMFVGTLVVGGGGGGRIAAAAATVFGKEGIVILIV